LTQLNLGDFLSAPSLVGFRQVFGRIFFEFRHATLAAELQGLALIDVFEWSPHFAERFTGDDALFHRHRGLNLFGFRGLAGNEG
jgi:hypothetical protein